MNKRELQARLEALEGYVHNIDTALGAIEQKLDKVSAIFNATPEPKTLQEHEAEMDAFIEKVQAESETH